MVARAVRCRKWCYKLQAGEGRRGKASLWCVSRRRRCAARAWLCGSVWALVWSCSAANYPRAVSARSRVRSMDGFGVVVLLPTAGQRRPLKPASGEEGPAGMTSVRCRKPIHRTNVSKACAGSCTCSETRVSICLCPETHAHRSPHR